MIKIEGDAKVLSADNKPNLLQLVLDQSPWAFQHSFEFIPEGQMNGIFTIQLEGETLTSYKLSNFSVKLFQNGMVNSQKKINVESPMSGVYMLEVNSDKNRKILKAIIK